jgi:glycosyltransferase involved in cell wall biosynthesis
MGDDSAMAHGGPRRVLMLPRYDAQGASSRLRMLQYMPALADHGVQAEAEPLLDNGYVADLYAGRVSTWKVVRAYLHRLRVLMTAGRYDVVWVEKELFPWVPAWVERLLLPRGAAVVADYDDAVFHRYDAHPSRLVRWLLGGKIDAVMRRAACVTAGNAYLARRAELAGATDIEILPTVVDLDRYPEAPATRAGGDVVIGWIGSPATAHYLAAIGEALAAVASRHRVRCVAIGARPDQVRGTPFEAWPWDEHTEVAMLRQFDIGIMPLPDAPWERGKCGYKLIQYMACGLPVVASPVGANVEIVENGVNGELAGTSLEWEQALERLVGDAVLRGRMGRAGRRRVEAHYSVQVQVARLGRIFDRTRARIAG